MSRNEYGADTLVIQLLPRKVEAHLHLHLVSFNLQSLPRKVKAHLHLHLIPLNRHPSPSFFTFFTIRSFD